MVKIVLATFGSLGDLHPKIALGIELRERGHNVTIAAMEIYREKIGQIGLGYAPMAPHLDPEDKELGKKLMDAETGTEAILKGIIMPNLREMYDDMMRAGEGADVLVTGEIAYAVRSVVEKTGIKWVSTSLTPISFFSRYDPPVPPQAPWAEHLRPLGPLFHGALLALGKLRTRSWLGKYREFRRELGLDPHHDPIFYGKNSDLLHLAMFSRVLAAPQPDWPANTVQTGFCFYDGQADSGQMPAELEKLLDKGEAPIVFTLGSAAVLDPRDFFEQSIEAAKRLGKRAVVLYGVYGQRPAGLTDDIVGFDYAPYSLVFPRAACVVHQGGAGTTGQVLRAGVPHLIMPYGHDQPDNAARCRRAGVAEVIGRDDYNSEAAARMLEEILGNESYSSAARKAAEIVAAEGGAGAAADAVEDVLRS